MPKRIPQSLCLRCKGYRKLCGISRCPILDRITTHYKLTSEIKSRNIYGSTPPSVIVGEKGYPTVPVLYNVPPKVIGEEAKKFDNPSEWWGRLSLADITKLRFSMVSSIIKAKVKDPWSLYEKEISLAAISSRPVASEAILAKKITPRLRFDGILAPIGPSAPAEKISISENPSIPRIVEKLIWDDVKAFSAIWTLYRGSLEFYDIVRALSLGLLGLKKSRRLVPTRWAITAVDSVISHKLLTMIKMYDQVNEFSVYTSEYLGNRFTIVLIPGEHTVEWIEAWHPLSAWAKGAKKVAYARLLENHRGMQEYMDGGYMAARHSLLEHLSEIRRKATAVIIREIKPEYYAPVGNWHIRMTVKNALAKGAILKTTNPKEILEIIKSLHPNLDIAKKSRLLKSILLGESLERYIERA